MRPILLCCTPRGPWHFPSGWAYIHAKDCPVEPNEKVRPEPVRQTQLLRLVHDGEDARAAVPTTAHPAGKGSFGVAVDTWLHHPTACDCQSCSYVEAHLDQDDDVFGGRR